MLGSDWCNMDPEELELQNDYRYRSYAAVIEKALRNFESSSEWADLISSLGKLNKVQYGALRLQETLYPLMACLNRLCSCVRNDFTSVFFLSMTVVVGVYFTAYVSQFSVVMRKFFLILTMRFTASLLKACGHLCRADIYFGVYVCECVDAQKAVCKIHWKCKGEEMFN